MEKITDWAQVVSDRIVEMATAVMKVQGIDADQALECILSSSCAGPKAIMQAQVALGLLRNA